jgi:hypothetical protein
MFSSFFTVAAFAIAVPQLARASDAGTGRAIKLAMGPMSAPLKNQGMRTAAANPATIYGPKAVIIGQSASRASARRPSNSAIRATLAGIGAVARPHRDHARAFCVTACSSSRSRKSWWPGKTAHRPDHGWWVLDALEHP